MAIGDDTTAQGWPIVPDTGENGKVKYGAREINLTRDYVAQVKSLVPTSKSAYRKAGGITSGTTSPASSYGENGDIYFKIV